MRPAPLASPTPAHPPAMTGAGDGVPDLRIRQDSFAAMLGAAGGSVAADPTVRARHAAEDLVAAALVTPVLKHLRETSQAAPPFGPGPGEKSFRALMDAAVAQQLVRRTHWPLVDRLAQRLLARGTPPEAIADASLHAVPRDPVSLIP